MIKTPVSHTANQNSGSVPAVNYPDALTVIVLDDKNQPVSGAHVSIAPSDESGVTDAAGQVQFQLGTSMKYAITASYGSHTVTVPYYVVQNGATRLVVNPVYVESVEARLHPSPWFGSYPILIGGIGLAVVILLVIAVRFFRRNRRLTR